MKYLCMLSILTGCGVLLDPAVYKDTAHVGEDVLELGEEVIKDEILK